MRHYPPFAYSQSAAANRIDQFYPDLEAGVAGEAQLPIGQHFVEAAMQTVEKFIRRFISQ